jgi:L-alanine-DL-glutamate epimerase-like enolase superfamily enzyme
MTIAPHLFPELVIHVLASIPNASWIEHMGLLDDLWVEPPVIEAGIAHAPERPGHGLAFKPAVLEAFGAATP